MTAQKVENDRGGVSKETAEEIDDKLDELGVAKSHTGKDQRDQSDREGSDSSSKDRDEA